MPCQVPDDPEVQKAFWREADSLRKTFLGPEEVIKSIADKHGLGLDQVGAILSTKKMFMLTHEAWRGQAKLAELRASAKRWANSRDVHPLAKLAQGAYELPRKALTIYHGGAIPFTHGRNSLYIPEEAGYFKDTVARAYSYATPKIGAARWRRDMALLPGKQNYRFARRAGLEIKMGEGHGPVGMGMSRWTRASFDALKPLRLDLFNHYWRKVEPGMRDFEHAQDLATRINHATGVVKTSGMTAKIMNWLAFAPKLRLAKYANVTTDLGSAVGRLRFAKVAAINLGLLGINDLVNRYVFGQSGNQTVNWQDPTRADWLRMKIAGMTIPMAPMFEMARLPVNIAATVLNPNKEDKLRPVAKEVASALNPAINTIYGGVTGKDLATGNVLPFKGVSQYIYGDHRMERKVFGKWRPDKFAHQEGKGEYAAGYAPIPVQPILKEMAKQGVPPDLSEKFLKAYAESVLSGLGGTHAYPDVPYKNNP